MPGVLLVVPTVLAALGALLFDLRESADRPTDDDLAAAAATVRGAITDDDAIVVAPPWSLRPLIPLGPLAARARPADGPWDALTAGRFARVFVIAEPDAEPWLADRPLLTDAHQLGRYHDTVVLLIDSHVARFDARAQLGSAVVSLGDTDVAASAVVCTAITRGVNGGVRCAGQPSFVRVAREWALVTENGADVVFAHPPPAGQYLEVAFSDVELGNELVVAAGHTRVGAERADPVEGAVRVVVAVDDVVVATLVRRPSFFVEPHRRALKNVFVNADNNAGRVADLDDSEHGFRVDHVDTTAFSGPGRRLTFSISTDAEANNDFAFDAFSPGGP